MICDLSTLENICFMDLMQMDSHDIYNESLKTSLCIANKNENFNMSNIESEMELQEIAKENVFECLIKDTKRIFKCSENDFPRDKDLINLFFDGLLDKELNDTNIHNYECILCFLSQFYIMMTKHFLAESYDIEACDFFDVEYVNLTLWYEVEYMLEQFLSELRHVTEITTAPNFTIVKSTPWMKRFLDTETWGKYAFAVKTYAVSLLDNSELNPGMVTFLLILHGSFFLIGVIGNCLLVLTFATNPEMHTSNNAIIVNLAIGDLLSLFSNVMISYMFLLSSSYFVGFIICLSITLFVPLGSGICVYSVTVLSIQRYMAITSIGRTHNRLRVFMWKYSTLFFITSVWILALASAIPQFLSAEFFEDHCEVHLTPYQTLVKIIIYCIGPIVIMGTFTLITSINMKKSVRSMPGEVVGHQMARMARIRSANILISLIVVFAISYMPYYLFLVAYIYFDLGTIGFDQMFIISHTLIFLNSCCNPIALYSASATYRKHFNRYLTFCCTFKLKFCTSEDEPQLHSQYTKKSSVTSTNL
ncbi:hypothetical protein C0J52_06806 [Blattella germanica]|nr:hypothetical protein C0J52_06806 [Blattella germanica]